MTKNTNIKSDENKGDKVNVKTSVSKDEKGNNLVRVGGGFIPQNEYPHNKSSIDGGTGSQFSKVLKRRRSRQSNFGKGCIDFNYAGDSSQYHHMIVGGPEGKPDNSMLNYSLNLRKNKNIKENSVFHPKPWSYPVT